MLDPGDKHHEIKCSGKCEGECKCTMFRLQIAAKGGGAFDPKNAKWELVGKENKQVRPEGNYFYRCFCLK